MAIVQRYRKARETKQERAMPLRFAVTDVFHLRQRGVVLASGRILEGSIAGRVTAYDESTGRPVEILGIELLPLSADHPERVTLIIDPSSPTQPAREMVLVSRISGS